jgi:hypothetical protein
VVSSTSNGSVPAESQQEQFAPESTAEYDTSWSLQSGLERQAGSGNPTNALSLAQCALLYPTQSWLPVQQPHLTHYDPPPAAFNPYFSNSQWPDNDGMRSSYEMESAKVYYGYNRQMPPSEMWFVDNIQNLNSAAPLVNTRHNFAETKIDNPWSSHSSTSSRTPHSQFDDWRTS